MIGDILRLPSHLVAISGILLERPWIIHMMPFRLTSEIGRLPRQGHCLTTLQIDTQVILQLTFPKRHRILELGPTAEEILGLIDEKMAIHYSSTHQIHHPLVHRLSLYDHHRLLTAAIQGVLKGYIHRAPI